MSTALSLVSKPGFHTEYEEIFDPKKRRHLKVEMCERDAPTTLAQGTIAASEAYYNPSQRSSFKGGMCKEYGVAVALGLRHFVTGVSELVKHPIEKGVKPHLRFAKDVIVLSGDIDSHEGEVAEKRMSERREELAVIKRAFEEGTGPERVEMATALAAGLVTTKYLFSTALRGGITKYNAGPPKRICHAEKYKKRDAAFAGVPREFNGVLSKDLTVVRFCLGLEESGKTTVWWTVPAEINPLSTMEAVADRAALLSRFRAKTHVTVARIPAGEPVRFLHGRAAKQIDALTGETKPGGMVQYQFYDFDIRWIQQTRSL